MVSLLRLIQLQSDKVDLVLVVEVVTPIQNKLIFTGSYSVTGNGGVVVLTGIEDHKHLLVDLVVDSIHLNTLLVLLVAQLNLVQTPVSVGSATMG